MANILLASLGESPVVVPVMYQLLKQKGIKFDKVQVLAPQGRWVPLSYDLVEEALQSEQAPEKILLLFEDANTERECLQYLQILAQTLRQHQQEKNMVYLSLAGGRKSMTALMAWIVPFFSCIQGLYHVIDPEKEQFPSVEEIIGYSPAKRTLLMKPDLETLKLVPIPYTQEQQTSYEIFAHLEEKLKKLQDNSLDQNDTIAAMTIFAARNLGLSSVYHTLIASDLNDTIEQDTTISALNNMTRTERNDRLFLRSYDRSQFHLFRVPVLTRTQLSMS